MKIQITAIKFEYVDGKKRGKSFTFKMDPKEMAVYKTEAILRKKIDEYVVENGMFRIDEMKDVKYKMEEFLEEWKKQIPVVEAEELAKTEASPEPSTKSYDLDRFVTAQLADYYNALAEIRSGHKTGHWIWYIFPQQKGLGHSYNSQYYGLAGIDEARAYLAHPVLGERLREICEALLQHEGKRDIDDIMGSSIDVLKLRTCMDLFNLVSPNDIFEKVIDAFY